MGLLEIEDIGITGTQISEIYFDIIVIGLTVWHEFCRVLGIDLIPFLPALAIEFVFFKSISDVCFLS